MTEGWLHESVCTKRHELWLRVGNMKLCVARDMNCHLQLVTRSCILDRDIHCG